MPVSMQTITTIVHGSSLSYYGMPSTFHAVALPVFTSCCLITTHSHGGVEHLVQAVLVPGAPPHDQPPQYTTLDPVGR
jgi:hypothetical protein